MSYEKFNDVSPCGRPASLYCKVGQKGGISVYGLQRWPITLYAPQWERLLDFDGEIREFIREHDAELKRKPVGR